MAIFPGKPGLAGYTGAKDDGSCGDSWSSGAVRHPVKLPSPKTSFLQAACPSPDQQCQSTEGND